MNYSKIFLSRIDVALIEFMNYHNLIEGFLLQEEIKLGQSYDVNANIELLEGEEEYPIRHANHLEDSYVEMNSMISVNYPHNFRSFFFIQLISFVEYELRRICEFHYYSNSGGVGPMEDWRSDYLGNAKNYLKESANIKIDDLNPEWGFIKTAKEIRNKFVHHHCKIMRSDVQWKNIEMFIRNKHSINFRESGMIIEISRKRSNEIEEFTIILSGKEVNEELLRNVQSLFKKLLKMEIL